MKYGQEKLNKKSLFRKVTMKKKITFTLMFILTITFIFHSAEIVDANGLNIDQGTLKTGETKAGHAASYSAKMIDGSSGETRAVLKPEGGATVWIQLGGSPESRKEKSGTYNKTKEIRVWRYGRSLDHGYTGVKPAY